MGHSAAGRLWAPRLDQSVCRGAARSDASRLAGRAAGIVGGLDGGAWTGHGALVPQDAGNEPRGRPASPGDRRSDPPAPVWHVAGAGWPAALAALAAGG